jgi:hypothetical protein
MMKAYEHLREMAEDELNKIAERGELSPTVAPMAHVLTDIVKNIDKIEMLEEGGGYSREGGGSYRGYSRDGGGSYRGSYDSGSYGGSYDGGYSERRGRDSRGRYTSRDDGKEHMMHQIREMMHNADGREREALERCMNELQKG